MYKRKCHFRMNSQKNAIGFIHNFSIKCEYFCSHIMIISQSDAPFSNYFKVSIEHFSVGLWPDWYLPSELSEIFFVLLLLVRMDKSWRLMELSNKLQGLHNINLQIEEQIWIFATDLLDLLLDSRKSKTCSEKSWIWNV